MRHSDRGTLYFPDGREFGEVDYVIDEVPKTRMALGSIWGHLTRIGPSTFRPPFEDFHESGEYGALRLADGRWWLCNIQADGDASNRGGLHPPGPQPKP